MPILLNISRLYYVENDNNNDNGDTKTDNNMNKEKIIIKKSPSPRTLKKIKSEENFVKFHLPWIL